MVAQLLAGHGVLKCAVDAPLRDGKTPLMLACKNGHHAAVELLLHHRADPRLHERPTAAAGGLSAGG